MQKILLILTLISCSQIFGMRSEADKEKEQNYRILNLLILQVNFNVFDSSKAIFQFLYAPNDWPSHAQYVLSDQHAQC